MLNARPYTLRQGIVTLGPGTTISRVTLRYDYTAQQGISTVTQFMVQAKQSVEFQKQVQLYHYWKLIGVKIIIPPRIAEFRSQDNTARISVDWTNTNAEDVTLDDSAKEVAAYSTKYQVYRFAPPNALLIDSDERRINYKDWITVNDPIVPPGVLKISSNFNFTMVLEVMIIFKGNQTEIVNDKIKIGGIVSIGREENKEEEKKVDYEEEKKDEKEEEQDVWHTDPREDRKPRWSNNQKKMMKLMKALENMDLNKEDDTGKSVQ